jgi:glycosyltransferase involved in cell wall biosynthesis
MRRVLFLTYRMARGYGVDVVVHELKKALEERGQRVFIACLDTDGFYPLQDTFLVKNDIDDVRDVAEKLDVDLVVSHTSPFHEMMPELALAFEGWIWEYGDPEPSLFPPAEAHRRRLVKEHKRLTAYPRVDRVFGISEFVRKDIGFSEASVVYCGADHVADLGLKLRVAREGEPLRIGTLMRLGAGEAHYKGGADFRAFVQEARAQGLPASFHVMGRGRPEDARAFEAEGIQVSLNADDAQKAKFLRGLDLFLSFSRWEGFNLPLVEAQALATASLALRAGAHPEVCPLLFSDLEGALNLAGLMAGDRARLLTASNEAYAFVRKRFRWARAAGSFISQYADSDDATLEGIETTEDPVSQRLHWALRFARHPRIFAHVLKNRLRRK